MVASSCPDVMSADGPLKCLKAVMEEGKDDLARFSITGSNTQTPIDCTLAVSFDNMTEREVKEEIDQSTHIMVAGAMRQLRLLTDVTYEKVQAMLVQNLVVEPDTGYDVIKSDRYAKTGDKSKFLVGGKPTADIQRDIKSWFTRTISDRTVLTDLNIDTTFMGRIITASSQCIDWLATLMGTETYMEKTIIDLGVLRFPDDVQEYFMLYKVELKAFLDVSREVFELVDKNGLYLTFKSKRFIPRNSIINKLHVETKAKAANESMILYTTKPKAKIPVPKRSETAWPVVCLADRKAPSVMSVIKDAIPALKSFDMKEDGQTPLVCNLAVAFDDLTASNIKNMGDFALVLVSGVNRTLKKESGATYESIKSAINDLSITETFGSIVRADIISKTYENEQFPSGSHEDVKREITLWFKKLINDAEILEDLQDLIDMTTIVNCLVTAGKHLNLLGKVKGEHEYNSRQVVDLTVLRYPDDTREYFHLYKIELSAFTDCTREMIDELDKCGLKGDFQAVKYGPRTSVLQSISKSTISRVANEALVFYGAKM